MQKEQHDRNSGCTTRIIARLQDPMQQPDAFLQELLGSFKDSICVRPLFFSTSVTGTHQLLSRVVEKRYQPPDFQSFFSITSDDAHLVDPLMRILEEDSAIREVYAEQPAGMPPAVFTMEGEPYCPAYLKPSPVGINAHRAWQYKGGKGTGIRFADVEQGWDLGSTAATQHPDSGRSMKAFEKHGSSVLAILRLPENEYGGSGIVPQSEACVFSQWRPDGTFNTADALLAALNHLRSGDVLLVQAQVTDMPGSERFWPAEIQPPVFEVIRLATALGITVVEAAANGNVAGSRGNDLDDFEWKGKKVLNRKHADFKDSGAVMAGAATCSVPHHRMPFSNYGNRVDCYAWGEKVNAYNDFRIGLNGTSSAAAIIAGAAISIQGIALEITGAPCRPATIRTLLGNPQRGTASARIQDQIGTMPDLEKILNAAPFHLLKQRQHQAVRAGNLN